MNNCKIKNLFVIFVCFVIVTVCVIPVSAETLQDRLQKYLNGNQSAEETTTSADGEATTQGQSSALDNIRSFFEGIGSQGGGTGDFSDEVKKLWDTVSDTDIGSVISEFDLQALYDMGTEAWNSGIDMIKDAIGGGSGTSDASDTGTTVPVTTRAVATTYVISYDTTPAVTTPNNIVTTPVTDASAETTTAETVTMPAVILTQQESVTSAVQDEDTLSTASKVVIIIMSVATIGVIIAIVIFAVVKKK